MDKIEGSGEVPGPQKRFIVYGPPEEDGTFEQLIAELLQFARENAGNRAWVAIKLLLDNYKTTTNDKIRDLDARLSKIENALSQPAEKDEEEKIETFGGSNG
jgi:phosphopantetheine adenylyltransferase